MIKNMLSAIKEAVSVGIFRRVKSDNTPPADLDSAINKLCVMIISLREDDRSYLLSQSTPQMFAATIHNNIGRSIRNKWLLWDQTSPIVRYMKKEYGITHADDISGVISMCTFQKLNNVEQTPKLFSDACIEYWETIDSSESVEIHINADGSVKAVSKEKKS